MNKLLLNKEIYHRQNIETVISSYRKLAEVQLTEKDAYFCLNFRNCRLSETRTICEFENYLISLEYQEQRHADL